MDNKPMTPGEFNLSAPEKTPAKRLIFCKESNTWVDRSEPREAEATAKVQAIRDELIKSSRRKLELAYQECPDCYGISQLHERDYCYGCDVLYPSHYKANEHLYRQLRLCYASDI